MTGSERGSGARIAVVDYGIGNLRSAEKALQRVGAAAHLTADAAEIAEADGVVLPGVGAFGACMDALERSGLDRAARAAVESGRPFLGICVGMQLLYEGSEETPRRAGLGLLEGKVRLLPPGVKRPQMQWNRLRVVLDHPLVADLDGTWMYFVHSYAADVTSRTVATADYGRPLAAVVAADNVWATQFHPEKSAAAGLRLLGNWVEWVERRPTSAAEPVGDTGAGGTAR